MFDVFTPAHNNREKRAIEFKIIITHACGYHKKTLAS